MGNTKTGQGAFSWGAVRAERKERLDPVDAQTQRVTDEYNAWFQRELKRPGANISTAPPEEFDQAIEQLRRRRIQIAGKHFDEVVPEIRAERDRRVAFIGEKIEALQAEMTQLYAFDREAFNFAGTADRYLPAPIERAYRALMDALAEYPAADRLRHTAPPPARVYDGPEKNPILVPR